jgi:hypothetical protein
MDVDDFIRVWTNASVSERQAAQSFVIQLCRVLGVAAPNDEKVGDPDYGFERIVRFLHDDLSSHWGYIDCYRRECFVLEAKQTAKRLANTPDKQQMKLVGPDVVERKMEKARAQAKGYARALDEWPPFLIMVDVGRTIELWSDFSRMGKTYLQYPDRENYRIALSDLRDPKIRERLAAVWSDPMSLDPARRVEEATTEIAALLGRLVQSFRKRFSREAGAANDPVHRAAWGTARGRLCDAVRFRHVCRQRKANPGPSLWRVPEKLSGGSEELQQGDQSGVSHDGYRGLLPGPSMRHALVQWRLVCRRRGDRGFGK